MKKILVLTLWIIVISQVSFSQDVIFMKDGDTIKCNIIEMNAEVVKYKRIDNPDGPSYIINKADVSEINFRDGTIQKNNTPNKSNKRDDNERRGYIGIMAGPAFPVGDFLNKDSQSRTKTGIGVNLLNYGYRIGKSFGFVVMGTIAKNNISAITLIDENNDSIAIDDANWSYGNIGIGIMITAPNRIADLDFRFVGNFMNADLRFPSQSIDFKGSGLGFDMGMICRIHINRYLSIPVSVDYLSGTTKFNIQGEKFKNKITVVFVETGLAYRIK